MRDIAALIGAAVGLSHLALRVYVHISAVSLCREARRRGWGVHVKAGWSPSLEVDMWPPRDDDSSGSEPSSTVTGTTTNNGDSLQVRGSRRDAQEP
jgi:hypothetical protein